MSPQCERAVQEVGNGIAASLRGVDCLSQSMTESAFARLFGANGALGTVLTAVLTLYVAFFAISLLTGRSSIGVRSLTPRAITIGLVLTFATSWVAYQSVVWNLATGAPDWIATVMSGTAESATQTFADKIDIVFAAIQQVGGPDAQEAQSAFSPQGVLWMGATLLLLGTVGVLVTARIALAVLVAIGPVFVVLALFPSTRGIFVGWLKGMVMLALTPLFAVLGGTMMLDLAVPVLQALNSPTVQPGQIDPRAAMAFFMIGAVHMALMVLVLKVAGTMVAGWNVFGLVEPRGGRSGSDPAPAPAAAPAATRIVDRPAEAAASAAGGQRRIAISGIASGIPANDAPATPGPSREPRIYATGGAAPATNASAAPSRTRGIGSRFRTAAVRPSESVK